ncbi:MAG TPA: transposase [Ktedonobacterales bacterium]|nr:transposase [Ktedonobacterales bacterium]
MEDAIFDGGVQDSPVVAQALQRELVAFLGPLLEWLDARLDRRLVRTLVSSIVALLEWRNRAHGLLLSELGAYVLDPAHAPAGTKRLSNLLRSPRWSANAVLDYLWQQADRRLAALEASGAAAVLIWDSSVLEKPESLASPDLGSVRSSKARRLTRIKPGFYQPSRRPIFVPGWQWLGVLLLGRSAQSGPPSVVQMRWWTNRGPQASDRRTEEGDLLRRLARRWGQRVCHVWDRGFAGRPWLDEVLARQVRFVLRWPGRYKLLGPRTGWQPAKAWQLVRGQRSWDHRLVWDARRHGERRTGVVALPVWRPDDLTHSQPLWLVVARRGPGQEPWYLLTSEPVHTAEDAWHIVYTYARRWQIEMSWRYGKSELALESPRLWSWERRQKLLLLATLAYAFLLSLLAPPYHALRRWLLRWWCHRTGKRSRDASTPLYRLRSALSRLWLAYLPSAHPVRQSSG